MIRKAETVIGMVGGVLSLLIFGVFSAAILTTDVELFERTIYSALPDNPAFNDVNQAYELMRQFSTWLGIFLFLMVVALVFATLFIFKNGRPKIAGALYIVTAFLLLIGTQGIGFPLAFLFFVSAYLCFFKKPTQDKLTLGVEHE